MLRFGSTYGRQFKASTLGSRVDSLLEIETSDYADRDGRVVGPYWLDEDEARELQSLLEEELDDPVAPISDLETLPSLPRERNCFACPECDERLPVDPMTECSNCGAHLELCVRTVAPAIGDDGD